MAKRLILIGLLLVSTATAQVQIGQQGGKGDVHKSDSTTVFTTPKQLRDSLQTLWNIINAIENIEDLESVLKDGTEPLTADWDAGIYRITAGSFGAGTAPYWSVLTDTSFTAYTSSLTAGLPWFEYQSATHGGLFKIFPSGDVTTNATLKGDSVVSTGGANISGNTSIDGSLSLSGRFAWEPARRITMNGTHEFPADMVMFRNEELDNTLSLAEGTEITVSAINTTADQITLSFVPYKSDLWSPTEGEEYALLNASTHPTSDPAISGDYADIMLLESGTYTTGVFDYAVKRGAEGNWSVGDTVIIYNPWKSAMEFWDENPVIEEGAAAWRSEHVTPAGCFIHSDGSLVMLVNGRNSSTSEVSIGAFKSDSTDWSTFSVLNSDAAIFSPGGTGWRQNAIGGRGSVRKLRNDDRYIMYVDGKDASNNRNLGWVKFDEDFTAGSLEYSTSVLTDTSATSSPSGHSHPQVTFTDGAYHLFYRDNADGTLTNTVIREAVSYKPDGTFTGHDTVYACSDLANANYASSHGSPLGVFFWFGRMTLITGGTSQYSYAGNKCNKSGGLWYRTEDNEWVQDTRNPVFINPWYTDEVWGTYSWAEDHIGNLGTPLMHPTDGYMYVPFSITSGSDNYKIGFWRLDVQGY